MAFCVLSPWCRNRRGLCLIGFVDHTMQLYERPFRHVRGLKTIPDDRVVETVVAARDRESNLAHGPFESCRIPTARLNCNTRAVPMHPVLQSPLVPQGNQPADVENWSGGSRWSFGSTGDWQTRGKKQIDPLARLDPERSPNHSKHGRTTTAMKTVGQHYCGHNRSNRAELGNERSF